jgi:hypothetical protein
MRACCCSDTQHEPGQPFFISDPDGLRVNGMMFNSSGSGWVVLGLGSLGRRFASRATFRKASYHGWNEALPRSNGRIAVVTVPDIRASDAASIRGRNEGPFGSNARWMEKKRDSQSSEWGNFGWDKSRAPQADWGRMTARGWPPPPLLFRSESQQRAQKEFIPFLCVWSLCPCVTFP